MRQSGRTGSGSALRCYRLQAEIWAMASFVGLLTGCLETAGVLIEAQSDAKLVAPDAGLQQGLSRPSPTFTTPARSHLLTENSAPALYSEEFWTAVADLDLTASRVAARSEPEVRFAEAVALLAAGDHEKAETAFGAMSAQSADLNVALAAQIMLATTLLYEQKWATLRDTPANALLALADQKNISGMERWGQAFANLDPQVTTFPQKRVSLTLRTTAVGTPTIKVRINGKEYLFWLDTGSTITVLSSSVAAEANVTMLAGDTLTVRTFAGVAPVRPAVLKRMEIGPIVIANSPAIVLDASLMRVRASAERVPWAGLAVDGIIGWDTIRQFDISLDYENGRITLQRPENLGTRGTTSQNLTWMGKPLVEVRTGLGGTLHFTLDTGAQASFVNASILNKVKASTSNFDARVYGIAGTGAQATRALPTLRLDVAGKSLLLKGVIVYAPTSSALINCDGILGSDIAQFGTIRIDATNGLFSIGA